jgi:hypothetical protein
MEDDAMDRTKRLSQIDREIDRALGETPPSALSADFTQRVSAAALRKGTPPARRVQLHDFVFPAALAGLTGGAMLYVLPATSLIPPILDEQTLTLTASALLMAAAGLCAAWAFGQVRATLAERSTIPARTSSPGRS